MHGLHDGRRRDEDSAAGCGALRRQSIFSVIGAHTDAEYSIAIGVALSDRNALWIAASLKAKSRSPPDIAT